MKPLNNQGKMLKLDSMKMEKFGIEIRRMGKVDGLYDDVDQVLSNLGMKDQAVSMSIQQQTVAHSLQKMFQVKSHFSVCTIKNCADLCQVCVPEDRMIVYQSIHCMSWNEMLPDYRQTIVAMVLDDFRTVLNN